MNSVEREMQYAFYGFVAGSVFTLLLWLGSAVPPMFNSLAVCK